MQGFQPGKDRGAAKVGGHDAGGTTDQLRLGDQLPELPGSHSGRHVQTPMRQQQGRSARHGQPRGALSAHPQALRGGERALREEAAAEQAVDAAERGRRHRCASRSRQRRVERDRARSAGAQQSVSQQRRGAHGR